MAGAMVGLAGRRRARSRPLGRALLLCTCSERECGPVRGSCIEIEMRRPAGGAGRPDEVGGRARAMELALLTICRPRRIGSSC